MDPAVSIVIPTYNRASWLKEALESVRTQTFRDFEVIVVDDGSTDPTRDIIESYKAEFNLRPLLFDSNHGVSWARNRGIEAARAPWIAFLDSDDLWLPRKLEVQTAYLKDHPELEIAQTEEIWIRRGVRVNPMKKHRKSGGRILERCLELCVVSPSATLLSRRILDEAGLFDESLPVCEDYDLWLRIACRFPIGLIPKPLIVKRGGHADQLSRKYPAMDLFRIRAIQNLLENHPLKPDERAVALRELERKCSIYAQGARRRGKTGEAERVEKISETERCKNTRMRERRR
jgi:glycosyltransferase involved in cell wall biosynthesis